MMNEQVFGAVAVAVAILSFQPAALADVERVPYVLNVTPDVPDALADARNRIRTMRMDGTIPYGTPIEIVLAPGAYVLTAPFSLAATDSGSPHAPVTWCAASRGTVSVRGGRELPWSSFAAATDSSVVSRLQTAVREHVLVADISADAPKGGFPEWPATFTVPPMPLLSLDGRFEEVARWPDAAGIDRGWATFSQLTDQGAGASDFASITTLEDRAARWDFSKGVWLFGYWWMDWDDAFVKASSWSASSRVLRLAAKLKYGVRLPKATSSDHLRYFAVNLPEELDAPGEYWVDRTANRLYYYPSANAATGNLVLSTLDRELVNVGAAAHDITFRNLTFESAAKGLVSGAGVRRIRLESCDFRALSGDAVTVDGRDNTLAGCTFRQIGMGCVVLTGGDRATLGLARNSVERCDMREYARFQRCYSSAVRATGCGHAVRGCAIRDVPHMAISYTGNEHFFAWNMVSNVLNETSDAGAFYTGRSSSYLGTKIVGNDFMDFRRPDVSAVYYDDCQWGGEVIGNTFGSLDKGIHLSGGNLHHVTGNVFTRCTQGFYVNRRGVTEGYERSWFAEGGGSFHYIGCADFACDRCPWLAAYPELIPAFNDEPVEPFRNSLVDNLFVDCEYFTSFAQKGGWAYAPPDRITIAGNATVSTDGSKADERIDGCTHYANRVADVSLVAGLPELQTRVAAFANASEAVVVSPGGRVNAWFGLDVTGRLCCRAEHDGETLIGPSSMGVTVGGVDYGSLVRPDAATVTVVASGKAVDDASDEGYAEVLIPLERLVDGDRSAALEARVFENGIAWRMRVAGTGAREVSGGVATWAEDGSAVTVNGVGEPFAAEDEVVTDWSTAVLRAADVADRVLTVYVPALAERSLTAAELEALNAGDVTNVVKTGTGALVLDHPLSGYAGSWDITGGKVFVCTARDAFGASGDAPVNLRCANATWGSYYLFFQCDSTVDRPLLIHNGGGASSTQTMQINSGCKVRFLRRVGVVTASTDYIKVDQGGEVHFEAGFEDWVTTFCPTGTGLFDFGGQPSRIKQYYGVGSASARFSSPSNNVSWIGILCSVDNYGRVELACEDALAGNANMQISTVRNGSFDLCGHDIDCGTLDPSPTSTAIDGTLTSTGPATLRFNQNRACTNYACAITGELSLEKRGPGEFAVDCPITSTGSLKVTAGTFRFLPGGSWTTASRITTTDGGTLAVAAAAALDGKRSVLEVSGNGQLRIADGVMVQVYRLVVDGVSLRPGKTYGGPNSAADVKLQLFGTGTGMVKVQERGVMIRWL